jgi:hypothetical protein
VKDDAATQDKSKQATGGNGMVPDFRAWVGGYGGSLENWAQSNTDMIKGATEVGQEFMKFSQGRLQAHSDAWKALAACRSPLEIFECQRQFTEKAASQYFDEASKLASRTISVMSSVAAPGPQKQTPKS